MHAVFITAPGGPEVLSWKELPDPVAGVGEVVLEVAATAVNRPDILQRQGRYPPPRGASEVPGLECSGRIMSVGEEVTGWSVGREACALLSGGGYATRVTVPAACLMPIPEGVDLIAAAALPEAMCTVWSNLFMVARLRPGELVLIHGGASGIGTAAIQMARAYGCRVAVTAGSQWKLARCAELGAEICVNYRDTSFVEAVREATEGRGADVVLDIIGAEYLSRNIDVLAANGRLIIIGLQGGARTDIDLSRLLAKRAAIIATTLRRRPLMEKAAICTAVVERVWPLLASGEMRPVIDRILPISEVAEAHRVVEAGEHVGKVVLTVADAGAVVHPGGRDRGGTGKMKT
jgi:putative PIG3 family NAD(P)H quinone oxidoreductase